MRRRRVLVVLVMLSWSCVAIFVWCYSSHFALVLGMVTLPSPHGILQLTQVIEAHKKAIGAKALGLLGRSDTEPKAKYPRFASDDYTTLTMRTSDGCGMTEELDAVIIVHSSAPNFEHRERYRAVYSDYSVTKPYKLKVTFLVGQVNDTQLQTNLEMENHQFGDTIQGNFLDTYQNLTLKAVTGFRWVHETCKNYPLLIKMDDDVTFDVHRFFGEYWHNLDKDMKIRRISGQVWKNAPVNRNGKWKVEKKLFSQRKYRFNYCSGFFVLITPDIVSLMYEHAKKLNFFWIDDVFMYGMVPHNIYLEVRFTQFGYKASRITQSRSWYKRCKNEKGMDCKYFAVVTSNGQEFMDFYNNFPHQLRNNATLNYTTLHQATAVHTL